MRQSVRRIAWAGLLCLLVAALLSACGDEPTTTPTAMPVETPALIPATSTTTPISDRPTAMPVETPALIPATSTTTPTSDRPTATAMPTPTHIATPTRLSQATFERIPTIVEVTAEPGSNAVLVRLSKTVYVRGNIWLDTSGGPTANADGSGNRMLTFKAGDLTGSVEVQGVGYGRGAALRDIHGSDAEISLQPMRWTIGDKPATWETDTDPSSPSEVEGIAVDGEYWRVSFTKPVFVVGDVRLDTSHGAKGLIERPSRAQGNRSLLFEGAPSQANYNNPTTVEGFRFDESHYAIKGIDGQDAVLDFEPIEWSGFPRPLVSTMADCVYDAYYKHIGNIDSIRADTISMTDPSELTDAQRFVWYEFFKRNNSRLMRSCVSLWSEEVTEENADKRNERYASKPGGGEGCIEWLKRRAREGALEKPSRLGRRSCVAGTPVPVLDCSRAVCLAFPDR